MRGMLDWWNEVNITIQNNHERVTKTRTSICFVLLENVHVRFLIIRNEESCTIWSRMNEEREEAIILAAPLGEHRIVGTADIETTRERSSWGITVPIIVSIYIKIVKTEILLEDSIEDYWLRNRCDVSVMWREKVLKQFLQHNSHIPIIKDVNEKNTRLIRCEQLFSTHNWAKRVIISLRLIL